MGLATLPFWVARTCLKIKIMEKTISLELVNKVMNTEVGTFVVYQTMPTLVKPKTTLREFVALFGEELMGKATLVSNARYGTYPNMVNNQRKREGLEADFVAQAPNGMHHIEGYKAILESDTIPGQYYMAIDYLKDGKTTFETHYIVGGHIATQAQVDFIKSRLYVNPKSKTQGTTREILYKTTKFENLRYVGKSLDEAKAVWNSLV